MPYEHQQKDLNKNKQKIQISLKIDVLKILRVTKYPAETQAKQN